MEAGEEYRDNEDDESELGIRKPVQDRDGPDENEWDCPGEDEVAPEFLGRANGASLGIQAIWTDSFLSVPTEV